MGDCFNLIRFDSMTPLEFVQLQSSFADIFTKDELKEIAKAIATQRVNRPETSSSSMVHDVVDSVSKYSFTEIYNSFAEIESLFGNQETADVFFVFKIGYDEPKCNPAHKCILAFSSTKFDELFFGPDIENRDIPVRQCFADEFSVFLHSFYGKAMPLTMANVSQVMYFADEYNAQNCLSACEDFLESHLLDENIFLVLELSYSYRQPKLYESCVKMIMKNYQFLLETNGFLNCSRDTIKKIVMIYFEVRIDFTIFEACIKWAKHACEIANINASTENLNETLGDIFGLIRFTSMTTTEFMKCQINYGAMFNVDRLKYILKGFGDSE